MTPGETVLGRSDSLGSSAMDLGGSGGHAERDPASLARAVGFAIGVPHPPAPQPDPPHAPRRTPFSPARLELLGEPGTIVCASLARGTTLPERCAQPGHALNREAVGELVMSLKAIGALEAPSEDEGGALAQWEHHGAMFHARCRAGRSPCRQGGTYRFLGVRPPGAALPRRASGPAIELPAGPLQAKAAALQRLMQRRRSLRTYGTWPLAAAELGMWLRLVAGDTSLSSVPRCRFTLLETFWALLLREFQLGGTLNLGSSHRCSSAPRVG